MEEVSRLESEISALLSDPLLSDIPKDVTPEEVEKLLALEKGQAFVLAIERPGLQDISKPTIRALIN